MNARAKERPMNDHDQPRRKTDAEIVLYLADQGEDPEITQEILEWLSRQRRITAPSMNIDSHPGPSNMMGPCPPRQFYRLIARI